ncbi:MAG: LPS export ABC transporter ATP-binding protein [Gammaproteobacteria bacterium CG11_big_fil_rev_8_21_14_0_20_46_22]|nr:MAG: LPS export ABC transporter ATP-binding protein [Gammaproteobacteria bacterium CG12_big_fil_rev_8_21_14_0_65_46_12]PIR10412.1 MAG: LPS export ABC transporter ATP-binding protein [Gammaproteobacteria bacterium CG11_big_fil_rev_8_21_14_0_20_46_22]
MSELVVNSINKSYAARTVVNEVSLNVKSGQIVSLLGPNGAGKTTAFYVIVGLVGADQGHVILDGENITKLPIHKRALKGLGYLPQEASIFRKLSVHDNIMAILELRKELSLEQRQEKLEDLLKEFHITHIRNNIGMTLSGGERRRVEIARALARDPKFICLDEPFAGVDPISVIDIKQIVRHLCEVRNIGVLITDHNVRETLDICDHAYIMSEGKILCEGDTNTILSNQQVRDVYLGDQFAI